MVHDADAGRFVNEISKQDVARKKEKNGNEITKDKEMTRITDRKKK